MRSLQDVQSDVVRTEGRTAATGSRVISSLSDDSRRTVRPAQSEPSPNGTDDSQDPRRATI